MSIAAKQRLIKNITSKLEDVMTVNEINNLIDVCTKEFTSFDIDEKPDAKADIDNKELLDSFLAAKTLEGRSINTIKRYRYIIERTLKSINAPIRDITVFHLRQYLIAEQQRGISERTLEGYREVYSSFFGWLQKESLLPDNPCANLGSIKYYKKVRLPFSNTDIEKMKECCTTDRDKAIIAFLLSTGCRISEMCTLDRNDIDFDKQECIVKGKGGKYRVVYLDDVAVMFLLRYLNTRKDNNPALFFSRNHTRLTPNGVRSMLKNLGEKAGVENVHPHRFRRTLATNLIHRGMTIQEVAKILGHDKLETTMKYVYLEKEDIKHSYKKYSQ